MTLSSGSQLGSGALAATLPVHHHHPGRGEQQVVGPQVQVQQRAASGSRRPGLLQGDNPVQVPAGPGVQPGQVVAAWFGGRRQPLKTSPSRVAIDGAATDDGVSVTARPGTAPSTRWSPPGRHGRVGSLP